MSANDNFSLHDDEELSLHDDASLNGSEPASNKGDAPAKPPQIITTNTLLNIKLPDKAIYSASVLEIVMLFCFLDDQLTSLSPKNCALLDVLCFALYRAHMHTANTRSGLLDVRYIKELLGLKAFLKLLLLSIASIKLVLLVKIEENILKYMDQDSAHMVAASKVPMLKLSEFELWRMRIEQYIQMIDYALWEVIENGATLPKIAVVEGVEQLKFNSIKDVKKLLEAIEKRFGGNEATKKTQRNLLRQQYENFTTPSSEMLDQSFDRL
ncbi:hypothetical protein Tco_0597846 [Tanacetum coccineum]